MDIDALADSPVSSLVPIAGNDPRHGPYQHDAFLPDPLPDALELHSDTWALVVEASMALSQLDQAGRQIPQPGLLTRSTIRREAQSTSALEGTYAAFTELLDADLDEEQSQRPTEIIEVLNYVRVAEHAFEWMG